MCQGYHKWIARTTYCPFPKIRVYSDHRTPLRTRADRSCQCADQEIEPTTETTSMPLTPGDTLFEYRITRVLGQGAFGTVYLAQDTLLDRPVAIKELTPAAQADPEPPSSVSSRSPRGRQPQSSRTSSPSMP